MARGTEAAASAALEAATRAEAAATLAKRAATHAAEATARDRFHDAQEKRLPKDE